MCAFASVCMHIIIHTRKVDSSKICHNANTCWIIWNNVTHANQSKPIAGLLSQFEASTINTPDWNALVFISIHDWSQMSSQQTHTHTNTSYYTVMMTMMMCCSSLLSDASECMCVPIWFSLQFLDVFELLYETLLLAFSDRFSSLHFFALLTLNSIRIWHRRMFGQCPFKSNQIN